MCTAIAGGGFATRSANAAALLPDARNRDAGGDFIADLRLDKKQHIPNRHQLTITSGLSC